MLRSLADLKNDRWGFKVLFHACACIFIFYISSYLAFIFYNLLFDITGLKFPPLQPIILSFLKISTFIFFALLYIKKFLKLPLADFRICRPKNIFAWLILSVTLPLLLSLFFILFTPGSFAVSELDREDTLWTAASAIFYIGFAAAITEELLFRGIIMRIVEMRFGSAAAVILPSVLFALLHLIVMETFNITDIFMLTIGGSCVGIMFSLIAIRSRSIWASTIVHGVWNLAIVGGILNIGVNPYAYPIFTYTLTSSSVLITGGAFGIESSLPAIILYTAVILLVLPVSIKCNKKS